VIDQIFSFVPWVLAAVVAISGAGIMASVHNTRLKIRHGYPLEGMWGQSLKPGIGNEAVERIRLNSQENAALRAELGSVKAGSAASNASSPTAVTI
jgi:hypothetical protein